MAPKPPQPAEHTMSFGDHLEELRRRVFLALAAPIPIAVIAIFFTDTLIEVLLLPLYHALAANNLPEQVQALSPPEIVFVQLKLAILVAVIMSAPWMLWQAWLFVSPGLYHHERRFVNLLVPGSAVLTIAGVLLLYFFMLPIMLNVMVSIGANIRVHGSGPAPPANVAAAMEHQQPIMLLSQSPAEPVAGQKWLVWPDMSRAYIAAAAADGSVAAFPLPAARSATISQQFRLSEYIDFVLVLALGTVLGFQMPLVVMLLGWIGIASPEWFRKQRKYALFGCGVASAIITPSGDLISMLVLMLPLYLLYELGIVLLVIAPASRVAEGRVFSVPRWSWTSRKGPPSSGNDRPPPAGSAPPAHTEPASHHALPAANSPAAQADPGEELRP
jgi:Sec-independent protein secretion pathway component TatC